MRKATPLEKIHWHPAFCGATEWELKEYKDSLSFEAEHQLSKEPLRMDMLVIKKASSVTIENEIGKLFKKHNVLEFKSCKDKLTIDDYYKAVAYAALYKGLGKNVNEIPAEDITLTIIREAYPRALFKVLEGQGVVADKRYEGIYYLIGNTLFDTQIIVTRELDGDKHASLKILSKDAREGDVRKFLEEAKLATEPGDLQNIDAVLQVSVSANKKLYDEVRKDNNMCQALRELMKDEIEEDIAEATANNDVKNIKQLMKNMKWTAEQAMEALGFSGEEQAKYSALL